MTEHTGKDDDGCPFCKIARGEDASAEIVCEGAEWVAFFPSEPATPGHTLVIPRKHVTDVWSLDYELGAALMSAVVRIGRAIYSAVSPGGMNLISSSGTVAEQSVFHLHLHVVPRYRDDHIDPIWPQKEQMDQGLKEGLVQRVRDACSAT